MNANDALAAATSKTAFDERRAAVKIADLEAAIARAGAEKTRAFLDGRRADYTRWTAVVADLIAQRTI